MEKMDRYSELLRTMREKVPVGESFDLLERKLVIGGRDASMFFVDGLVDGGMMQRVIFSLFSLKPEKMEQVADAEQFIASNLPFLDAVVVKDLEKAVTFLYSGAGAAVHIGIQRDNHHRLQELSA